MAHFEDNRNLPFQSFYPNPHPGDTLWATLSQDHRITEQFMLKGPSEVIYLDPQLKVGLALKLGLVAVELVQQNFEYLQDGV